jgi:hypothetical protein
MQRLKTGNDRREGRRKRGGEESGSEKQKEEYLNVLECKRMGERRREAVIKIKTNKEGT